MCTAVDVSVWCLNSPYIFPLPHILCSSHVVSAPTGSQCGIPSQHSVVSYGPTLCHGLSKSIHVPTKVLVCEFVSSDIGNN